MLLCAITNIPTTPYTVHEVLKQMRVPDNSTEQPLADTTTERTVAVLEHKSPILFPQYACNPRAPIRGEGIGKGRRGPLGKLTCCRAFPEVAQCQERGSWRNRLALQTRCHRHAPRRGHPPNAASQLHTAPVRPQAPRHRRRVSTAARVGPPGAATQRVWQDRCVQTTGGRTVWSSRFPVWPAEGPRVPAEALHGRAPKGGASAPPSGFGGRGSEVQTLGEIRAGAVCHERRAAPTLRQCAHGADRQRDRTANGGHPSNTRLCSRIVRDQPSPDQAAHRHSRLKVRWMSDTRGGRAALWGTPIGPTGASRLVAVPGPTSDGDYVDGFPRRHATRRPTRVAAVAS